MQITKTVDLGNGCLITLASLTYDQVEKSLERQNPTSWGEMRAVAWDDIVMGFRNVDGQQDKTKEDIKELLNAYFLPLVAVRKVQELHAVVMELSGYEPEKKKPGEEKAATAPLPESTSEDSAAA